MLTAVLPPEPAAGRGPAGRVEISDVPDITVVQLDAEAPPGLIVEVAGRAGVALEVWDVAAGPPRIELASATRLIVLGSAAAGVEPEGALVAVVRERLRAGRPVLGLGAGAQLLAIAAGGAVRRGESHEFGYVDLAPTDETAGDPVLAALGDGLPVMEWHDDAVDLPPDAAILARCIRGRPQAFRLGPPSYGLRFHPGATAGIVRRWAALRGAASNNPAIRVRIGTEIVRHQERAERFGRAVIAGWLGLVT